MGERFVFDSVPAPEGVEQSSDTLQFISEAKQSGALYAVPEILFRNKAEQHWAKIVDAALQYYDDPAITSFVEADKKLGFNSHGERSRQIAEKFLFGLYHNVPEEIRARYSWPLPIMKEIDPIAIAIKQSEAKGGKMRGAIRIISQGGGSREIAAELGMKNREASELFSRARKKLGKPSVAEERTNLLESLSRVEHDKDLRRRQLGGIKPGLIQHHRELFLSTIEICKILGVRPLPNRAPRNVVFLEAMNNLGIYFAEYENSTTHHHGHCAVKADVDHLLEEVGRDALQSILIRDMHRSGL